MSIDIAISDLRQMYRADLDGVDIEVTELSEADVKRWSAQLGMPRNDLYDSIAMYLARGFYNDELPFTFCDRIINHLNGVIYSAHIHGYPMESPPKLFEQVYGAFDAGEYYHNNNRNEDPKKAYTRPLIAEIIEKHSTGS